VISLSSETPWKPRRSRSSRLEALAQAERLDLADARAPWKRSVMMPDCDPVNDAAFAPRFSSAMASSAIEMRSPPTAACRARGAAGFGMTCAARLEQVVRGLTHALTTATRWCPAWRAARIRSATASMRSGVPTEVPPNFWTRTDMDSLVRGSGRPRQSRKRWP
jgi:hypothetical protein